MIKKRFSHPLYSMRITIAGLIGGLKYRIKVRPNNLRRFIAKFVEFFLALFTLLGFTVGSWDDIYPSVQPYINTITEHSNQFLILWNTWPILFRFLLISFVLILLLIIIIDRLTSKERLFEIATSRLNDKVDFEEKKIATLFNFEAKTLLKMISNGKNENRAYTFLSNLWASYIYTSPSFSMFYVPGYPQCRPIVSVNIEHLTDDENPEDKLNSMIEIQSLSRFENFSIGVDNKKFINNLHKNLLIRKPTCRYLSRYQGPTKINTGFDDDYTGYNVCLSSMNLVDGKLETPIASTLELYGNIMDSSDALINELYLHFSFDKYSENIPSEVTLKHLPWRYHLHKQYKEPIDILTKAKERAAGLGISALTVFNQNGEHLALRGLRSTKVGTFPNVYHVIPSGMSNVDVFDNEANQFLLPNNRLNIQLIIEKEFLEEVFNQQFLAGEMTGSFETWTKKVKQDVQHRLYGKENEYRTNIYLTGIVFDLLNYRPEICALILIRDKKWWEDQQSDLELSYEWLKTKRVNIFNEKEVSEAMPPDQSVPAGIAAFHLGIKKAHSLLKG